jgi:hypothetical protein
MMSHRQGPSAPGTQGNRTWGGRGVLALPACGRRVGVRRRLRKLRLATVSLWRSPLARNLRENAQIPASPRKPAEVGTATTRDGLEKAGEGAAR